MSPVLWLALLLGYLVGAGAAMVLLPPEVVSPLYGALALATVVVVACVLVGLARYYRRSDRSGSASPPTAPGPPRGGRRPMDLTPDRSSWREHERSTERNETGRADGAGRWPIAGADRPSAALSPDEVRQALLEERVRIAMCPLQARPAGPTVFRRAAARLCDVTGRPFAADRYRPTLARCGLLGIMDRIVLAHAVRVLRRAGPGGADLRLVCSLDSDGLGEAAVMAELERLALHAPEVLCRLVLELERGRLDRPSARLMRRLRLLGAGFCLHRLSLRGLADEGLQEQGFDFVRITGDPGDDERAVGAAAAAGLTVLWPGAEPAELVVPGSSSWGVDDTARTAA